MIIIGAFGNFILLIVLRSLLQTGSGAHMITGPALSLPIIHTRPSERYVAAIGPPRGGAYTHGSKFEAYQ
ncbi:hypothetical protein B9Z19DRAFT_1073551 [Tuber borchii]|uniref:Uncharacterized protein n=1 Tax=Tuber borchii TaxID=42251 RepID=A0A2T7A5Y8_TUBBO|nr:hypothetical protein B9Z19DRAFT_1073551 [Tuber borchii]